MKKRYSFLIIILVLIVIIAIMECFTEKEETVVELPVSEVVKYDLILDNAEIHINLLEINSKKRVAKMINNEIRDLFEKRATELASIHQNEESTFEGKYVLASEYAINQNLLSLKIYETDSNMKGTAGNIYSVVYDIKNDVELNVSALLEANNLDYNDEIQKAENYIKEKNTTLHVYFPYVYLNSKGNIEIIARSIIQVSKFEYWNNIEIYEIIKKQPEAKVVSEENEVTNVDNEEIEE